VRGFAVVPAQAGTHNPYSQLRAKLAKQGNCGLATNKRYSVWVPAFAGTTTAHDSSPVLFEAPGRPPSLFRAPRKAEGMERRVAPHLQSRPGRRARPLAKDAAPRGAPLRRLTADGPRFRRLLASRSGRASALLGTEPLLPRQDQRLRTVSQLLAGGLSVPGRSPSPPERVRCVSPRPRAPRPAPSS
jgi:hypothetical protein